MDVKGYLAVRDCLIEALGTPNTGLSHQPEIGENLRWVSIQLGSHSMIQILNALDQADLSDRVAKDLTLGSESKPRLLFRLEKDDALIFEDLNV